MHVDFYHVEDPRSLHGPESGTKEDISVTAGPRVTGGHTGVTATHTSNTSGPTSFNGKYFLSQLTNIYSFSVFISKQIKGFCFFTYMCSLCKLIAKNLIQNCTPMINCSCNFAFQHESLVKTWYFQELVFL